MKNDDLLDPTITTTTTGSYNNDYYEYQLHV
jgi:hypothetical protein